MTRASTMLIALLTLNLLLGGVCLFIEPGEQRSRGLRLWGVGLLMYAAGLLITLASFLPLFLSKVAGNGLIAYSPIFVVRGALEHTSFRFRGRWLWAGFAASMLPIVLNHWRETPVVLIDFLSPAPLANVLFLIGAAVLWRQTNQDIRTPARFLAGAFVYAVAVWTLRVLLIWRSVGASNDRDRADLTVALFVIAQLMVGVALTLGLLWVEVRSAAAKLERMAYDDQLTGLPNRRGTLLRFREEAARAARRTSRLALVLFDVDHFKRINDTHGHLVGDAALEWVAKTLDAGKRQEDVLGRIGGEEFVLLMADPPDGDLEPAADRLRKCIASQSFHHDGESLAVTVSGGIAVFPDEGRDWDSLFTAADRRLYSAKQNGRNRVEAAG